MRARSPLPSSRTRLRNGGLEAVDAGTAIGCLDLAEVGLEAALSSVCRRRSRATGRIAAGFQAGSA